MWNEPSREILQNLPTLYQTENISLKDKLIHLHFFIFSSDWFIAEFDGEDLFWGFTILNNDLLNAEWGYTSFRDLKKIEFKGYQIDCDIYWKVCKASKVPKICEAQDWN